MKPTKASRDRHANFRACVSHMLTLVGATVKEDNEHALKLSLPNKRVCDVEFIMHKGDGEQGKRPDREFYCLFSRLAIDAPDFAKHVSTVNEQYAAFDKMGPSGKWNILWSNPQDVYNELDRRLKWLMS